MIVHMGMGLPLWAVLAIPDKTHQTKVIEDKKREPYTGSRNCYLDGSARWSMMC